MIGIGIFLSVAGGAGSGGGAAPIALFIGDPFVEGVNDSSVIIRFSNMTVGLSWALSVSSSGGGAPVADSGTVATATFDAVVDLTPLNSGTLTVAATQDGAPITGDTAPLLPPFDFLLLEGGDYLLLEGGDRLALAA
jgi:hypothetical protein